MNRVAADVSPRHLKRIRSVAIASIRLRPAQLASVLCLLLLLSVLTALAHGPFDNSSRLYVLDDHLELALTVGLDGARQILAQSALSPDESAGLLAVSGPASFRDAPVALATRLFEIKAGADELKPQRLKLFSDGLEANFTVEYPRTTNLTLAVTARYFAGVAPLLAGALVVTDENGNILGRAVLSRADATALVPIARPVAVTNLEPSAVASNAIPASTEPIHIQWAKDSSARSEKSSRPLLVWFVTGLAILLAAWFAGKKLFRR